MTKNQEEYYKAYFASIDFNETIDVSKLNIKGTPICLDMEMI